MRFSKRKLRQAVKGLNVPDYDGLLPEYKVYNKKKVSLMPRIAVAFACAFAIIISVAVGVIMYGKNTPQIIGENEVKIIYSEKADSAIKIFDNEQNDKKDNSQKPIIGGDMNASTSGSISGSNDDGDDGCYCEDNDSRRGKISADLSALLRENKGENVKFSVLIYFNSQSTEGMVKTAEYDASSKQVAHGYISAVLSSEQINELIGHFDCDIYCATR
ncbi:MAG: hypothetical protein IKK13_03760 [Clostridia bacterium]|nr:hypothetical protein [Clostridia bacterium]